MAQEAIVSLPLRGARSRIGRLTGPVRTLLLWIGGAGIAGFLLGLSLEILTISVSEPREPFDWWFVWQAVFSTEAICLSALVLVRHTPPSFASQPPAVRYPLILVTLLGSTIVATFFALLTRPTVIFVRPETFLALAIMNSLLATMLGGALITWETMRRSLDRAYERLREQEAFEKEMELARDVQRQLLPDGPPSLAGYEFAFVCRSAAAVGGDTLDFVPLPGDRMGVVIGDVVGKGMAAALQMANVQALVRALAPLEGNPRLLNTILSEVIGARSKPGRFVTLAYVILEPETGALRYSLAGHHPPIIVGPQGTRELQRGGLPLGILADVPYEVGEDRLAPGESMILFTDGVTEAPPEHGSDAEFGKERVIDIAQRHRQTRAHELLEGILGELDAFRGSLPAFDDTTLVVVRRRGEEGS